LALLLVAVAATAQAGTDTIVLEGDAVPGGGLFDRGFTAPTLNASGTVGFAADLTGTTGGAGVDDVAIYLGGSGGLTEVVRRGDSAAGNGTISDSAFSPVLNAAGTVATLAQLTGTSGGTSDDAGIFLGDGVEVLQAVRKGDAVAGSTITNLAAMSELNNFGQIAYRAELLDGREGIFRFTPELHWRAAGSGTWDGSNWTVGLTPAYVHDVFIDPASGVTVTGPAADTRVKLLTMDTQGTGASELNINGGNLFVADRTVIRPGDTLFADSGAQVELSQTIENGGSIIARNGGNVDLTFAQMNNGLLRATDGGTVTVALNSTVNGGFVEAAGAGSVVDLEVFLSPSPFPFPASGATINNAIVQAFDGGRINVGQAAAGNSNASINGGSVRIFFNGMLTGGGDVNAPVFNTNGGIVSPGASPGILSLADYTQDGASTLVIELAGLLLGTEYDQLAVAGAAALAGALDVNLLSGFTPALGDSFDILSAETLSGQFDTLLFPTLGGGLFWDIAYLPDFSGTTDIVRLSVASVPEPLSVALVAPALLGLAGYRRRRAG